MSVAQVATDHSIAYYAIAYLGLFTTSDVGLASLVSPDAQPGLAGRCPVPRVPRCESSQDLGTEKTVCGFRQDESEYNTLIADDDD